MNFQEADLTSLILFVALISVLMVLFVAVSNRLRAPKGFTIGYLIYVGLFSGLVLSSWVRADVLPQIPLLFGSVLAMAVLMAFSSHGTRLAEGLSFAALVGFQAFRLPLELILHHWAKIGTVPATMTWTGQNWDILAGLAALCLFPFANRSRAVVWSFQIFGFLLLLNVLRVVLMSSPLPFAWDLENPVLLIAHFPYALIGPLCVGPALAAHLITFRKLWRAP